MADAARTLDTSIALTLGGAGAVVAEPGGPAVDVPARPSQVVDTVGAGDCFAAALTVALAERRPLADAARWAVVAAGLAVERRGAQTGMPHRREVDDASPDTGDRGPARRPVRPLWSASRAGRRVTPVLQSAPRTLRSRVGAYVALTKPRIIELLLVTTVPTMIVAAQGMPSIWLIVATVLGGTFAAGGANAINMYVDRDIDAADEAHPGPAAGHRRRHAPRRAHLRHRPRGRRLRLAVGAS